MGGPFLGVELPDKFETNSSESAPEVSDVGGDTDKAPEENGTPDKPEANSDKPGTPVSAKPAIFDLDKHERVRFKGKEWSTKDLTDSYLRHEDYTRKVQLVNEERKYAQNFEADLAAVVETPALLAEFKKVYPPRYVRVVEKILSNYREQKGAQTPQAEFQPESNAPVRQLDPAIQEKLDKLLEFQSTVEERVNEAKVAQDSAQIETWFDEYSKKYPSADVRWVNFEAAQTAERLEADGRRLSKEDAKALVERCFKSDHEAREKQFNERMRSLNQAQKAAGRKAQDMGSGGGVPSAPPRKAKSLKEATQQLISDADAGRLS